MTQIQERIKAVVFGVQSSITPVKMFDVAKQKENNVVNIESEI